MLSDNLKSIGEQAFAYCSSLQEITIPDSVISIEGGTFNGCTKLQQVTLSNNLTSIGMLAFFDCTSLQEITIPDSVTSIGKQAFFGYTSLANVYCLPTVPPELGEWGFGGSDSDAKIYVPQASVDAYKAANGWSRYASMIVGYDF